VWRSSSLLGGFELHGGHRKCGLAPPLLES
jgi:hypothetical protein